MGNGRPAFRHRLAESDVRNLIYIQSYNSALMTARRSLFFLKHEFPGIWK